jgi:hypothetical protein
MSEVHDLVYHGRGGFPYDQVYNMPVTYRRYHIRKIQDYLDKKAETEKKSMNSKSPSSNKISKPNIPQSDFTSKLKAPKR